MDNAHTKKRDPYPVLKYNQNHFRQANDTPFGHQGNLAHHIDPNNKDNSLDELLSGNANFPE